MVAVQGQQTMKIQMSGQKEVNDMPENRVTSILKNLLILMMAPFVGLLFVVSLPFITIVALTGFVGSRTVSFIYQQLMNIMPFSWRPTEAYLAGKKKKTRKNK